MESTSPRATCDSASPGPSSRARRLAASAAAFSSSFPPIHSTRQLWTCESPAWAGAYSGSISIGLRPRARTPERIALLGAQHAPECRCDAGGDLVLDLEDLLQRTVEAV